MTTRYEFSGVLTTETGLHIGSGRGNFDTDALFVRTGQGEPYIPGSSLKGALRSAVERMVASLQEAEAGGDELRTCQLDGKVGNGNCCTVHQEWQAEFSQERERGADEETIAAWLFEGRGSYPHVTLCATCRLFGSPYVASKVFVPDLALMGTAAMEIRHGVGIDRDTGTAREHIKFDYEAAPVQTQFAFHLHSEELDARDLGLLSVGLRELQQGHITLGGNASRGLGGCRLMLERIVETDLDSPRAWLDHLLRDTTDETPEGDKKNEKEINVWLDKAIRSLLETL